MGHPGIVVAMNFHFAAFTYLYEWVCYDRHFIEVLAFARDPAPTAEEACRQLVSMATHYNVIRNFKAEGDGTDRLLHVWNALKTVSKPVSQHEAKDRIEGLVAVLKAQYRHELVSAVSKILWMRFGSPIVIYDSLTVKALKGWGCPTHPTYGQFYDAWQKKFCEHEDEIGKVCEKLKGLSAAREFFDPGDIGEQEFDESVSTPWFRERVFDHALLNAAYAAEVKATL